MGLADSHHGDPRGFQGHNGPRATDDGGAQSLHLSVLSLSLPARLDETVLPESHTSILPGVLVTHMFSSTDCSHQHRPGVH